MENTLKDTPEQKLAMFEADTITGIGSMKAVRKHYKELYKKAKGRKEKRFIKLAKLVVESTIVRLQDQLEIISILETFKKENDGRTVSQANS